MPHPYIHFSNLVSRCLDICDMAARVIQSISIPEFARILEAVRPPSGWSETLGNLTFTRPQEAQLTFSKLLPTPEDLTQLLCSFF